MAAALHDISDYFALDRDCLSVKCVGIIDETGYMNCPIYIRYIGVCMNKTQKQESSDE